MFTANKPNCGEMFVEYRTTIPQKEMISIKSSRELADYFRSRMFDDDMICFREEMFLVMLNRASKVIGWCRLSIGGFSGTLCDPKLIFFHALHCGASKIAIAHNHPSGNLKPSHDDKSLTKKIADAALLFDITFLDHIILTKESYYSFVDEGLI